MKGLATGTDFRGNFRYAPVTNHLRLGLLTLAIPTCLSSVVAARHLAALPTITIVRYVVETITLRLDDAQHKDPQLVFKAAP